MRKVGCSLLTVLISTLLLQAQEVEITSYSSGLVTWPNVDSNRVYEVEWASSLTQPDWTQSWKNLTGIASTVTVISVRVPMVYRVYGRSYNEITNRDECYVLYSNALRDSWVARPDEVVNTLLPVSTNTPGTEWRCFTNGVDHTTSLWIKVVALKFKGWVWDHILASGPVTMSNGFSSEFWVTLYPELRNLCANYKGPNQLLRMEKALGLPPRSGSYGVAEFFVDPKYLFRPAPDLEINDNSAGLAPDATSPFLNVNPLLGPTAGYAAWYAATFNSRGYDATNNLDNCWPWTRLGYTYDYENSPHHPVGLSEYIVLDPGLTQYWGSITVPIFVESRTDAETYGH